MKLFHWFYYAFNRWRYGENYGCGRCHHSYHHHEHQDHNRCTASGCPCREYSIQRVSI